MSIFTNQNADSNVNTTNTCENAVFEMKKKNTLLETRDPGIVSYWIEDKMRTNSFLVIMCLHEITHSSHYMHRLIKIIL